MTHWMQKLDYCSPFWILGVASPISNDVGLDKKIIKNSEQRTIMNILSTTNLIGALDVIIIMHWDRRFNSHYKSTN